MKYFSLTGLCAALVVVSATQTAMAADGEINFIGNITGSTCATSVNDQSGLEGPGDVMLSDVSKESLKAYGDTGGNSAFTLSLDDVSCTASTSASVRFSSMTGSAGSSGQWIGIDKTGEYADNVAIQIKDATGKDVLLGEASGDYTDLTQPLRFTANYIATGEATPGPANAKVGFTIDYK